MSNKSILTIQSLSCFGKSSLTIALPVLSAAGFSTTVMPTVVLSTHSGGYGIPEKVDMTDFLSASFKHWNSQNISFNGIYSGYLGDAVRADVLAESIEKIKALKSLFMCDPAFGDNGKLYGGITPDFPKAMLRVCKKADIITPNITEACFLTDTEYREDYDHKFIEELLTKLFSITNAVIIITGVKSPDGKIGSAIFENGTVTYVYSKEIPVSYHGSGDLFSAVLFASLLKGSHTDDAVKKASDFVSACLEDTYKAATDERDGIAFEKNINKLRFILN